MPPSACAAAHGGHAAGCCWHRVAVRQAQSIRPSAHASLASQDHNLCLTHTHSKVFGANVRGAMAPFHSCHGDEDWLNSGRGPGVPQDALVFVARVAYPVLFHIRFGLVSCLVHMPLVLAHGCFVRDSMIPARAGLYQCPGAECAQHPGTACQPTHCAVACPQTGTGRCFRCSFSELPAIRHPGNAAVCLYHIFPCLLSTSHP